MNRFTFYHASTHGILIDRFIQKKKEEDTKISMTSELYMRNKLVLVIFKLFFFWFQLY